MTWVVGIVQLTQHGFPYIICVNYVFLEDRQSLKRAKDNIYLRELHRPLN